VPFDEIVLEKDVNQNVISGPNPSHGQQINGFNGDGLGGRSYSSANIPQQRFPPTSGQGGVLGSFRSSTMSLPDESRRLFGIKESAEDLLQIPTIASVCTGTCIVAELRYTSENYYTQCDVVFYRIPKYLF
jgi:hypothetical protein